MNYKALNTAEFLHDNDRPKYRAFKNLVFNTKNEVGNIIGLKSLHNIQKEI